MIEYVTNMINPSDDENIELVIHVILVIISLTLLITGNFGFSVYHVVMFKEENSHYVLLNILYQQFAAHVQIETIVVFTRVNWSKTIFIKDLTF